MAARGTGSVMFMCDVTTKESTRMNSGLYRAILLKFSQNAAKVKRWHSTVQMENDPKKPMKATKELLKVQTRNNLPYTSQSPDLNAVEQLFSY